MSMGTKQSDTNMLRKALIIMLSYYYNIHSYIHIHYYIQFRSLMSYHFPKFTFKLQSGYGLSVCLFPL